MLLGFLGVMGYLFWGELNRHVVSIFPLGMIKSHMGMYCLCLGHLEVGEGIFVWVWGKSQVRGLLYILAVSEAVSSKGDIYIFGFGVIRFDRVYVIWFLRRLVVRGYFSLGKSKITGCLYFWF